jgi:integrase
VIVLGPLVALRRTGYQGRSPWLVGIDKIWRSIRKGAGLEGIRLHDLRHSFASVGAIGGLSLPIIGALLGHKHAMTTARYAHLSADPVRAANEAIGSRIAAAMVGQPERTAAVVPLTRKA